MKELSKPILTWLLGLFNVGVYNLSDNIDSLVFKLRLMALEGQAEKIISLHQIIEAQQQTMVVLDGVKCLFMLLSLVLLFFTNQVTILNNLRWCYLKIKSFFSFFKTKLNLNNHG